LWFGGRKISFTEYDLEQPVKNSYNYYETKVNLNNLTIKGSSTSYELQETIFSNIIFGTK